MPATSGGGAEAGSAGKKGVLEATVSAEVASEAERLIGGGVLAGLDFEVAETEARRAALRIMGQAMARRLNRDHSDHAGAWQSCACGGKARYAGRRPKTFVTALGAMTLERAWYHCARCHAGFSPRDRALGLQGGSLSPAALRMTGAAAARVSFAESSELLRELAGLGIHPKRVERQAEGLGQEIAEDERHVIEPEPSAAQTLYLGLDGTGAPVRKDAARGRRGKQPDGSAKTREAKIAAVWSAETPDKDGSPIRDPHSASYNAAIETAASRDTDPIPAPFTRRVLRESERRRFDQAPRSVILGDGTAWIWRLADEHFPEAIQVVDIFHAKGHLFDAAKAVYGAGSDLARQWGKQRRDELDQGRISEILAALRDHAGTCEEAKKCIDYIANNRSRMQYP